MIAPGRHGAGPDPEGRARETRALHDEGREGLLDGLANVRAFERELARASSAGERMRAPPSPLSALLGAVTPAPETTTPAGRERR